MSDDLIRQFRSHFSVLHSIANTISDAFIDALKNEDKRPDSGFTEHLGSDGIVTVGLYESVIGGIRPYGMPIDDNNHLRKYTRYQLLYDALTMKYKIGPKHNKDGVCVEYFNEGRFWHEKGQYWLIQKDENGPFAIVYGEEMRLDAEKVLELESRPSTKEYWENGVKIYNE